MTPLYIHNYALKVGLLPMWTIYDKPTDYPDEFVARMHVAGEVTGAVIGEGAVIRAKTLNEVREKLPPGLHCLGRESADEAQIVETWI